MSKPYELKNPNEVRNQIERTTDRLGMPVDKGILRSVVILNSLGFNTSGSCEGHEERYNTSPWVDLKFSDADSIESAKEIFFATLFKDLEEFYKNRKVSHEIKIIFREIKSTSYIVRLCSNSDLKIFDRERELHLRKQFLELTDFCEYLNHKYKLNY